MWHWANPDNRRYYQANLVQDLFGDLTLVRAWRNLDSQRGNPTIGWVASETEGLGRIRTLINERERRGYSLAATIQS